MLLASFNNNFQINKPHLVHVKWTQSNYLCTLKTRASSLSFILTQYVCVFKSLWCPFTRLVSRCLWQFDAGHWGHIWGSVVCRGDTSWHHLVMRSDVYLAQSWPLSIPACSPHTHACRHTGARTYTHLPGVRLPYMTGWEQMSVNPPSPVN